MLQFLLPHIQQPDAYLVLLTWLSRLFFSHSGLLASTDTNGLQQLLPPAVRQHQGLVEAADQPESEVLGCPGSRSACIEKTQLACRHWQNSAAGCVLPLSHMKLSTDTAFSTAWLSGPLFGHMEGSGVAKGSVLQSRLEPAMPA